MSVGNQATGVYEDRVLHWARFDAMPAELRRVYALAPFNMHMGKARHRQEVYARAGADTAKMRKAEVFYICERLQRECLATYGAEHPDAGQSRLGRRMRRAPVGGRGL